MVVLVDEDNGTPQPLDLVATLLVVHRVRPSASCSALAPRSRVRDEGIADQFILPQKMLA